MIAHRHCDLGGLVARGGTEVEDPVSGLRIEEMNRQKGHLLLHVVEPAQKSPMLAGLTVLDEDLEAPRTPGERLERYPIGRQ
jgi:hypothetical protein